MVAGVTEPADGVLDGLVVGAGIQGAAPPLVVSVNYFGAIATLEGLRPLLAAGTDASVVAISSNSATAMQGVVPAIVDACLAGDEAGARAAAEAARPVRRLPVDQAGAGPLGASRRAEARVDRRRHPAQRGRPGPDGHTDDRRARHAGPRARRRLPGPDPAPRHRRRAGRGHRLPALPGGVVRGRGGASRSTAAATRPPAPTTGPPPAPDRTPNRVCSADRSLERPISRGNLGSPVRGGSGGCRRTRASGSARPPRPRTRRSSSGRPAIVSSIARCDDSGSCQPVSSPSTTRTPRSGVTTVSVQPSPGCDPAPLVGGRLERPDDGRARPPPPDGRRPGPR